MLTDDFLANEETLDYCRAAWEPTVSDWSNSDEWEAAGALDAEARAHAQVERILAETPDTLLDEEQERDLARFMQLAEAS